MKDLGRCYQFGAGCMGNMKTALEWYTKASEVLDDPELDQRVMAFQRLANIDPSWGEDYPGEDDLDADEENDFPDGVFDATEAMRKNLEAAEARRKAEEVRRRKEEQRQRAEAERKLPNKQKKQREDEEKKAYQKSVETWKQAVKKTEADRRTELDRRWAARKKELIAGYDKTLG